MINWEMVRGIVEEALNAMLDAHWQRCMVHFSAVSGAIPIRKGRDVTHMLKTIHARESRKEAQKKADAVIETLR